MRYSSHISRYLIRNVGPYFLLSWLLLSVVLFVQQAGRFADIFFNVNIPATLIWQLMIALIPNVIAFTCPMAMLVGTVIGLSKMQEDSELVAMRAAGVGNFQITLPIAFLGIALSAFAFFVNIKGVPLAASMVRQVALKTAIEKLDSPIEPGIFNTEIAGYTIYVKSGDVSSGRWRDLFVYQEEPGSGNVRLITSKNGRIDVSDQISELVLEDATVITLPPVDREGKYVSERIGDVRLAVRTRRAELIERLSAVQGAPEEMGLAQLSEYAASREGKDRTEAQILWQRRIILSITPLIFALLGTALVLRFNRGGRGFGALLAVLTLLVYYLVAFLGEQMIRVGNVSPLIGGLMPMALSVGIIIWLNVTRSRLLPIDLTERLKDVLIDLRKSPNRLQTRNILVDLTAGLRDLDLLANLVKYFLLALLFTGVIFTIFTAFELWKFAGEMDNGISLLARYLAFLLPFVYLQLAPTCVLIAVIATYVIKARKNELVTWISAGQSMYRLLAPCLVACLALGVVNWVIQENVLPYSNRVQDEVRTRIRSRGAIAQQSGRIWQAEENRLYSFEPAGSASDNENRVRNLQIYDFAAKERKLQSVYRSAEADRLEKSIRFTETAQKISITNGSVTVEKLQGLELPAERIGFSTVAGKPSHLATRDLEARIGQSGSVVEQRIFRVALHRRYSTPLLPLVIALFTAPFALSIGRKGKVLLVAYALGLWLLFIGFTSVFEQLGFNGVLSPELAIWMPLLIFAALGFYLLSHIRT